jgi:D-alanyl-D-alanine carboxypeptidase
VDDVATRPRTGAPRGQSAIGRRHDRWRGLFIAALGSVGVSVIILIVAIAASCGGGHNPSPTSGIEYLNTPSATNTSPATATNTSTNTPVAKTPSATATTQAAGNGNGGNTGNNNGNGGGNSESQDTDNTPLLPCGDILVPLDKDHRLAANCSPPDLVQLPADISAQGAQYMRSQAASALEQMFADAAKAGYQLVANSTYRSYQTQVETFNYWVSVDGLAYAERTSARPGHSEHQLGTVADVGTAAGAYLEDFTGTPEAAWLDANCYKYGFIVSYPPGTESITGYASEPWHIRYVGVGTAQQVHASGKTLHQFLLGQ